MMQSLTWRRAVLYGLIACTVLSAGCLHLFYRADARDIDRATTSGATAIVKGDVRAHMASGATAVFRDSVWIGRDTIRGDRGEYYPLLSAAFTPVSWIHMDSVVAVEGIGSRVDGGTSTAVSLAATAVAPFATALLMVAIFGSCPTVYADTGNGLALQAEGFSYAIAPFFENRDVDPLQVRPDTQGVVRLELRNEALETHFINHVVLRAVRHDPNVRVVPDQNGRAVAVGAHGVVHRAVDRHGRDVRSLLSSADGTLYQTAPAVLQAAHADDLDDWIDIDVADLPAGDSVAVVLRLRNSLLNTILLYEGMLGGRDAIDWLDRGLQGLWHRREAWQLVPQHDGPARRGPGSAHGQW